MVLKKHFIFLIILLFSIKIEVIAQFDFDVNGQTYTCPQENYHYLGSPILFSGISLDENLGQGYKGFYLALSDDKMHGRAIVFRTNLNFPAINLNWSSAYEKCNRLNFGNREDWKLPSKEDMDQLLWIEKRNGKLLGKGREVWLDRPSVGSEYTFYNSIHET